VNDFGVTICDSIAQMPKRASNRVAVKFKSKSKWVQWSWSEYYDAICSFGIALLEYEVYPGQRVGILSNSRLEWAITDAALLALGAISVPIYPTLTPVEIEYIIKDSNVEILIIEGQFLLNQLQTQCPQTFKKLKYILLLEKCRTNDARILSWHSILENGRQLLSYRRESFEHRLRDTRSGDIATIVYTSGLTGEPKGAVLTHTQIMSELSDTFPLLGVSPDDISLSVLPFSHILGRIELWGHWFVGFQICLAESQERFRHNLLEINPTILMAVPRIFEKIHAIAISQIESNLIANYLFKGSFKIQEIMSAIPDENLAKKAWHLTSDLLLRQIKGLFGNRLRFAVCGGAKLQFEIAKFFDTCGVTILEGYGLTETTGAITVNRPFEYELGTVGKPIGDVQIKLDLDGEILVKSKKVMSGYLNKNVPDDSCFVEGWFRTGDIGEWTTLGNLKIIDRKKELIKTLSGKYVSPLKLSQLLLKNKWISQAFIIGNERKFIVALITLNKPNVLKDLRISNINETEWVSISQSDQIKTRIKELIVQTNKQLASFESIKRFAILPREFSAQEGEITASLKLKTRFIEEKYKEIIDKLYLS